MWLSRPMRRYLRGKFWVSRGMYVWLLDAHWGMQAGYRAYIHIRTFSIYSLRDLPLFAWHPILMCVAWLFLAPVSWSIILSRRTVLKKDKRWSAYVCASILCGWMWLTSVFLVLVLSNRTIITQLHAASIFLGVVSAALAGYAIYTNKVHIIRLICITKSFFSLYIKIKT